MASSSNFDSIVAFAQLVDAPETHGTVLTRAGMRVRLDLSASGGSPSKWLQVTDITPRGGARAPPPEPASAPAPVQPAADEPEEGTPVKEEPTEQVTPAKPEDKPEEKASEPANEEPKELAPWQKEARTPAKDRPKPSASPKVAETPALPSIGDLSAVPSDQKDSQLEKDRESAMDAIRAVAQAAADQAQDPFKAAVAALKEAATEDSKYKKAAAGDKANLVVEVISQYSRALRIAGVAQESSKVKTGVKTALKGKVDTVQARFEKLKAEVPLEELEQLEERLQEEGAKAAALLAADFDEQLSQAMSDWENQWKQAWVAVHGEESTATPTTKAKRGTGKGPPKVPKGSGKAAKAKSKPKPEPEPEPESESDDAEEAEEAEEPEEPEEAEAVEQVDDATADADVDAGTASVAPTRTKIELPEMTRGVPIQAPKYNPPPRMEHGLLYEVGDSRIYLESTVLKPLEKALKDLSLARPQSAAHYLGEASICARLSLT